MMNCSNVSAFVVAHHFCVSTGQPTSSTVEFVISVERLKTFVSFESRNVGGALPQGMKTNRPITIKKNPPQIMIFRSSNRLHNGPIVMKLMQEITAPIAIRIEMYFRDSCFVKANWSIINGVPKLSIENKVGF